MRAVVLIVSTVVALLPVASDLADAERDPARASVRIAQLSPLVIAGGQFRPRERIVIRVTAQSQSYKRTMRTTRRGTFAARFAALAFDRCGSGLSVVVTGATGLVAKTRMPPTLCPPALP